MRDEKSPTRSHVSVIGSERLSTQRRSMTSSRHATRAASIQVSLRGVTVSHPPRVAPHGPRGSGGHEDPAISRPLRCPAISCPLHTGRHDISMLDDRRQQPMTARRPAGKSARVHRDAPLPRNHQDQSGHKSGHRFRRDLASGARIYEVEPGGPNCRHSCAAHRSGSATSEPTLGMPARYIRTSRDAVSRDDV